VFISVNFLLGLCYFTFSVCHTTVMVHISCVGEDMLIWSVYEYVNRILKKLNTVLLLWCDVLWIGNY